LRATASVRYQERHERSCRRWYNSRIATLTSQDKQVFASRIQHDPIWFCDRVLGASLWAKQQEIIEAVRDTREVYVPSCHSSGKSSTAAHVALWFLFSHPNSIVVTTAPTGRQVKKILWQEIRKAYIGARVPLQLG
jgi:phage terminase large subunit